MKQLNPMDLWRRIRTHQFWGLTIIAWWLIFQGAAFALLASSGIVLAFRMIGRSSFEFPAMLLMAAMMCIGSGMHIRMRHPTGWWGAVVIFGLELSFILAAQLPTVFELFGHTASSQGEQAETAIMYLKDALPFFILSTLPLLYLARPKVRREFGI